LVEITGVIAPLLADDDPEIRLGAADFLAYARPGEAVLDAIRARVPLESSAEMQVSLFRALSANDAIGPTERAWLETAPDEVRYRAAWGEFAMGKPPDVDTLVATWPEDFDRNDVAAVISAWPRAALPLVRALAATHPLAAAVGGWALLGHRDCYASGLEVLFGVAAADHPYSQELRGNLIAALLDAAECADVPQTPGDDPTDRATAVVDALFQVAADAGPEISLRWVRDYRADILPGLVKLGDSRWWNVLQAVAADHVGKRVMVTHDSLSLGSRQMLLANLVGNLLEDQPTDELLALAIAQLDVADEVSVVDWVTALRGVDEPPEAEVQQIVLRAVQRALPDLGNDETERLLQAAASRFVRWRTPGAQEFLADHLRNREDLDNRIVAIAEGLLRHDNGPLIKALRSTDTVFELEGFAALSEPTPDLVEICRALRTGNVEHRQRILIAARIVAKVDGPDAVRPYLLRLLEAGESRAKAALDLIEEFGDPPAEVTTVLQRIVRDGIDPSESVQRVAELMGTPVGADLAGALPVQAAAILLGAGAVEPGPAVECSFGLLHALAEGPQFAGMQALEDACAVLRECADPARIEAELRPLIESPERLPGRSQMMAWDARFLRALGSLLSGSDTE
jgi:hypothetical protein